MPKNTTCEIVLVRGSQDENGYPCGRTSTGACSDCGGELCDLHAESCELCGQAFCAMCLWLHEKETPKTKPAQYSEREGIKRSA